MILIEVDGSRRRSPPGVLTVPSATGTIKLSPFIGLNTSFAWNLRTWSSDASISSNSWVFATIMSPFQVLSADNTCPRNFLDRTFWTKLMCSRYVLRRNRVILDHYSTAFRTTFHMVSSHQTRDLECFADSIRFHGIRPPFFIQIWLQLQHYRRCPFFHAAHCSFCNPMCFWRSMIPRSFFARFAKL